MQQKTIVLFVSDLCHCFHGLLCHDWNYMIFLWTIVRLLSTENTLPLSPPRRLSFLFDSWWLIPFPQHRSGFWSFEFSSSDQFEVLQLFSIVDSSAPGFAPLLDHKKPTQSGVEQNSEILTCTILPGSNQRAFHSLIIVHDPIRRRKLEHHHSVNLKRTKLRVLVRLHKLRLTEKLVDHVRNLFSSWDSVVFFEHAALRHLLSFGNVCLRVEKLFQCRRNHRIKHIVVREVSLPRNQSRCYKFVNWFGNLNVFDPEHTGWQTSPGHLSSLKNSEWLSFWPPFPIGMGSFGRSGRSKCRCGSQISIPLLGLSPPFWRV